MRLLVSFSFGESSATLVEIVASGGMPEYDEIVFIASNTGQEDERSLVFGDYVDRTIIGGKLVWVESVVLHNQRKSCGHRLVTFKTAHRGGDLFESMIQKYGIPNRSYPHCTRSLKLEPITSYARSIGWERGTYDTAIGIRKDELDRVSSKAVENRIIYPLVDRFPMTKKDVNAFWRAQPYRLEIEGYRGNCVWCWKKTIRKHYTLAKDDPSIYELPARLERDYPLAGHNKDGTPRTFFRENRSTQDILEGSKQPFTPYHDENRTYDDRLDVGGGCGESCEVYADE